MIKQKTRNEIDDKYKWDLTAIFKNDEEFLNELEKCKDIAHGLSKFKGHILDSADSLYDYFKTSERIERKLYKLYYYANLKHDEDTTNPKYQEYYQKIQKLLTTYSEETSFVAPEMMQKDLSYVKKLIEENSKLKEYEHNLEDFYRYKEHTLTDKEEKILSTLSDVLGKNAETFEALTDSDLKFGNIKDENGKIIEFTESNWSKIARSPSRNVRKKGFKLLYKRYAEFKNTLASTFSGNVDVLINLAKIRNFPSSLEASLFDDAISKEVYINVINTVKNNLEPLYNYYNLKKECLGLDKMHLYDIYVDLKQDYNREFTFDEAKDLVFKALKPLGDDYLNILQKAFDEKWIDIYNNVGKRSGAYSSGFYDTYPYVLLNFEGKLDDVSTLAHELGHSVHTYLSCHNNTYNNSSYKIFVAEVASTVNEMLLRLYLLNNSKNDNEKLYILNQIMELFKSTIYRQTMFAEFEMNMHNLRSNGEALTYELLCQKYYDLNKIYFGKNVIVDKEIMYEWERIPHFYYDFYVYKYVIGLACACKIANDIYNKAPNALENYKKFLKSGGSNYPSEELKYAGIDITKPDVLIDAIKFFDETVKEYQKILRKR